MELPLISYYCGILIIVLSHVYMLTMKTPMDMKMMHNHAYLNLFAVCLIAYWFYETTYKKMY